MMMMMFLEVAPYFQILKRAYLITSLKYYYTNPMGLVRCCIIYNIYNI